MPASSLSSPSISAVVASRNEGDFLLRTVHGLLATLPADAEIVVVDDDSTDGSASFLGPAYPGVQVLRPPTRLGSAAARNFGARAARGRALVFCDAHIIPPMGWAEPLLGALDAPGVGASGPAISAIGRPDARGYGLTYRDVAINVTWLPKRGERPYGVPILGGCCLAMRRDVFDAVGGFDGGILGWGAEDVELSLRLWLFGYECRVVPTVAVAHRFRSVLPHPLEAGALWHNLLRVGGVHFGRERLGRMVASLSRMQDFPLALARFLDGDGALRRAAMVRERVHDDDWYFGRFGIEI